MISNRVTLLLQTGLRKLIIMNDQHVVTLDIRWATNLYSNHPQLILYSNKFLHENLHGQKLRLKHRFIYCDLLLGEPLDQRSVKEDEETRAGHPCLLFSCVVMLLGTTQEKRRQGGPALVSSSSLTER